MTNALIQKLHGTRFSSFPVHPNPSMLKQAIPVRKQGGKNIKVNIFIHSIIVIAVICIVRDVLIIVTEDVIIASLWKRTQDF